MSDGQPQEQAIPTATIRQRGTGRWVWLIPIAAVVFVGVLIGMYVVQRGEVITVTMTDGHGIKPGDALRCRGINVGQVQAVALDDALRGVVVTVRLTPGSERIARAGSRFWVQRPRVSLTGVAGLETIAGPRYMAVIPGTGEPQSEFIAVADPPVVAAIESEGLEIMLLSDRRHSLSPGAPILYRGVRVGVVLGLGLSSDAASIEVRGYIRPQYASLVRDNTRFWNVSGAKIDAGLTGFSLELESLESLITGGVAMATPNTPGRRVTTGHRFELARELDEAWQKWRPALAVGTELLPSGASRPDMLRATRRQNGGGFFGGERRRNGWLLPVAGGVIGPADLLAKGESTRLEVAGQRFELTDEPTVNLGGLTERAIMVPDARAWVSKHVRRMDEPEDCVIMTDPALRIVPLASSRMRAVGERWRIDPIVSFDAEMHGAAVLSRADGALVGLLLVENGAGIVAPLPRENTSR
ncbi:MCE family protein [Planctomycetales bacterium ZRK34]|nr:MCE family protein [Planctomycetales bacterium ZRK34]